MLQAKDLNCAECDEKLKKERGCVEKGIMPFFDDTGPTYRCPLKQISALSWEYLRAFSFFQKGFLPNGSGWGNESDKFLEAMQYISNRVSDIEDELAKKK